MKTNLDTALDKEAAVQRMAERKTKTLRYRLRGMRIVWSYIPATAARNWDGSSAGQGNDPNQEILQLMVWKKGENPRYTNWW